MTGAKAQGYTLIELLLVMMLFAMSLAILSETFINFVRLSHKTSNQALIQEDMRYSLEYLARVIRNTPIDYSLTWPATTSTLSLIQANGQKLIITKAGAGDARCADSSGAACLLVSQDGGTNWAPLSSKKVNVDDFNVFVYPTGSPFELNAATNLYDYNTQPYVTVRLKLTYLAAVANEQVSMTAQTAISSRVYAR